MTREAISQDILSNTIPSLQCWDTIEPWQQDNEYIIRSYRPSSGCYWKSLASLTYIHNQTVNIYSHIFGAVVFSLLAPPLYYAISAQYGSINIEELALLACFFLGAVTCFCLSAYFHLMGNHSHEVYSMCLTMDLFGIVCLITATSYPLSYYAFSFCHPKVLRLSMISITMSTIMCTTVCFVPKFSHRSWRRHRAAVFTTFGLVGISPLLQSVRLYGLDQAKRQIGWSWFALGGLMYISGAVIYAARIPERFRPGTFDVWGSSHQIFHILVVAGAALHLKGILTGWTFHNEHLTSAVLWC